MPHVIVEYSANIEAEITPQRLVGAWLVTLTALVLAIRWHA